MSLFVTLYYQAFVRWADSMGLPSCLCGKDVSSTSSFPAFSCVCLLSIAAVAVQTVPPSGISTTAASTYGTQLSSPVASDAGSGFVRGPVPGPGSTPSVVIPASTGTAIGVVAGSGGGVGGMSYQVAMEKASSSLTSEVSGTSHALLIFVVVGRPLLPPYLKRKSN